MPNHHDLMHQLQDAVIALVADYDRRFDAPLYNEDLTPEALVGVDKTAGQYDQACAMAPLPSLYIRGVVSSCVVRYRKDQGPYISVDIEWDTPQLPGTWPELPRSMHDDEWSEPIAIGSTVTFTIEPN